MYEESLGLMENAVITYFIRNYDTKIRIIAQ